MYIKYQYSLIIYIYTLIFKYIYNKETHQLYK